MRWLAELLFAIGVIADLVAYAKSREYRRKGKRNRWRTPKGATESEMNELYEPVDGKFAWFVFLVLTPLILLWAIIWFWFKNWLSS
jgi:hypothetical protein